MFEVNKGAPPHQIKFCVWDTSNGIVGCLTGGESPHVGGVVLAVPRASLTGTGNSCDCWIIPISGHKDAEVVAPIAEEFCKTLNVPVSLTAGVHMDSATSRDIKVFSENCADAGKEMLELLKQQEKER